jgi:hypothetical protein
MPKAQLEQLVAAAELGSPRKVLAEMADGSLGFERNGKRVPHTGPRT